MNHTTRLEMLEQICASLRKEIAARDLDATVWEDFYKLYTPLLQNFARHARCPEQQIEDVVCAIWIDVVKYIPTYDRGKGKFRTWLYRLVNSKTIDEVRKRIRHRDFACDVQTTSFWNDVVDPRTDGEQDPLSQLLTQELFQALWDIYQREASDNEREVVYRCWVLLQGTNEVAEGLGLSNANVRKLRQRGLLRLRVLAAEAFGVEAASS